MDAEGRRRLGQDLVRLAAGERDVFDGVFAALWPPLLALSQRLLGTSAEAEDAAQEALMKLFARVDQYDPSRDPLSWAFAIAAFEARTLRKRRARRREVDPLRAADRETEGKSVQARVESPAATAQVATPEAALVDAEIRAQLAAAVDLLSPTDRAEIEGYLGIEETAASEPLGVTRRKRRQRALARLKTIWRNLHGFQR